MLCRFQCDWFQDKRSYERASCLLKREVKKKFRASHRLSAASQPLIQNLQPDQCGSGPDLFRATGTNCKSSAKSSMGSYRRECLFTASAGGHFEPSVHQKRRDQLFTNCISHDPHDLIRFPFKLT